MAPSTSNPRVLQLPKFAVVDVMISLNGRECLTNDKWEVKNAFWKAVLYRLNELYPDNVSEVRTINHVKRTWSALRQRVLQRFQTNSRDILPSDMKVLYLLGEVDSYDEEEKSPLVTCEISQQQSLSNLFNNISNYDESLFDESLPANSPSLEPLQHYIRPQLPKPAKKNIAAIRARRELQERLILCRIEREKAKTELINAQRRLVEAQLRHLDKNGGSVDLFLNLNDPFKN